MSELQAILAKYDPTDLQSLAAAIRQDPAAVVAEIEGITVYLDEAWDHRYDDYLRDLEAREWDMWVAMQEADSGY